MTTFTTTYDALLSGASWNGEGVTGRSAFLTFSFEIAPADYLSDEYSAEFLASFQPLSEADKNLAREALRQWSEASGLVFFEVPAGQGDIRFGAYEFDLGPEDNRDAAAFAYYPLVLLGPTFSYVSQLAGDVFIDIGESSFDLFAHEIGHALGLKHPHEGDHQLHPSVDDLAHTVMTYNFEGGPVSVLGSLDLPAISHIYGLNSADGSHVASWSWDAAAYVLTQTGGAGADTILGVAVADVISGEAGDDYLVGADGNDRLQGGDGDDFLSGLLGADTQDGGPGADTLEGEDGFDSLSGGDGDDILIRYQEPLAVDGGAGVDELWFLVFSDEGVSVSYADLTAGGGSFTNIEVIAFFGDIGDDTLTGGAGVDVLVGGDGDDLLVPGAGADEIWGGSGRDTVDFSSEAAALDLRVNETRLVGGQFEFMQDVENLIGTGLGDRLRGDSADNRLFGRLGDDTLTGDDGLDYLRGEEGADSIEGGAQFDDLHGNMGDDTVAGGGGDDWVVGGKDQDVLYGDAGLDRVLGNLGNDTLDGGGDADVVRGGQASDLVLGGAGDDWLAGDRGDDTVTGGTGADIFHTHGEAGLDRVTDFNRGEGDRVNLLPGTTYTVAQVGADVVITMTGGGQMVLVGVQLSALTGDWIFTA